MGDATELNGAQGLLCFAKDVLAKVAMRRRTFSQLTQDLNVRVAHARARWAFPEKNKAPCLHFNKCDTCFGKLRGLWTIAPVTLSKVFTASGPCLVLSCIPSIKPTLTLKPLDAGTFIQHDNLNILRQYLHKPYLLDSSTTDYITAWGFWKGLLRPRSSYRSTLSLEMWASQLSFSSLAAGYTWHALTVVQLCVQTSGVLSSAISETWGDVHGAIPRGTQHWGQSCQLQQVFKQGNWKRGQNQAAQL